MGLDILAYSRLQLVKCAFDEEGEPIYPSGTDESDFFRARINPDFPGRADELVDGVIYRYAEARGVPSMGYGEYGQWREELACVAGWAPIKYTRHDGKEVMSCAAAAWEDEGGPFWELINFSDCCGTIGAAAAKKLAKDFADFADEARAYAPKRGFSSEYFYEIYQNFRAAFELAADGGAVDFF